MSRGKQQKTISVLGKGRGSPDVPTFSVVFNSVGKNGIGRKTFIVAFAPDESNTLAADFFNV